MDLLDRMIGLCVDREVASPIVLRDFAVFSTYTTEEIPAEQDVDTELEWFWDGVHFQTRLGEIVLSRRRTQPRVAGPPEHGSRSALPPALLATGGTVTSGRSRRERRRTRKGDLRYLRGWACEGGARGRAGRGPESRGPLCARDGRPEP
jgi:hypothetical protein